MSRDLCVERVCRSFEGRKVLDEVCFSGDFGEAIAIVGPSGSGKSTLLNIVGSLDAPDSGTVRLGEVTVDKLRGREQEQYRNRMVGFLFQEHHLLPQLSAFENVLVPTLAHRRSDAPERATGLLRQLGVESCRGQSPASLSGGERQRVALARALINDPILVLCDEPTGSLDQAAGSDLIGLLLGLAHESGKIAIVVTHNPEHAARFDRVLTLCDGRLT